MEAVKPKQKKKREPKSKAVTSCSPPSQEPTPLCSNIETEIQSALQDVHTTSQEQITNIPSSEIEPPQRNITPTEDNKPKNCSQVDVPQSSNKPELVTKERSVLVKPSQCSNTPTEVITPRSPKTDKNVVPKVLVKPPQTQPIYPELKSTAPPLEAISSAPVFRQEQSIHRLRLFTEEELQSFYYNSELQVATSQFIHEFIQTELQSGFDKSHYLTELINKYIESKNNKQQTETDLDEYKKQCLDLENAIWVINKKQVSAKGVCNDNASVTASTSYDHAEVKQSALQNMTERLSKLKKKLHDDYVLHSYSSVVLKLQIEFYIQCITNECRNHAKLTAISSIQLIENALPLALMQQLRVSLSILFSFIRRSSVPKDIAKDIREWIESLVGVLLRVASWRDHLFILHHILRCPGAIAWGIHFIQVPCSICEDPFSSEEMYHLVTVVATVLLPVQDRDAFISEWLGALKSKMEGISKQEWILVDSDGEGDEDLEERGAYPLREIDIISILNQIPLEILFKNLLRVENTNQKMDINLNKLSEVYMVKLLAWSCNWIRLLGFGIHTYSSPRYRQLTKLISRFINYTMCYLTESWILFCNSPQFLYISPEMKSRLQIEYDGLLIRSIQCIYLSQNLGAWQFLAIMPFEVVSSAVLWMLYYMLIDGHIQVEVLSSNGLDKLEIQSKIQDRSFQQTFEEKLSELPDAEAYYLLQTFSNMAIARTCHDYDFIQVVTLNLLHIGFICPSTREHHSKSVRDLLCTLTTKYPTLISVILSSTQECTELTELWLYLFKELPLHTWIPSEQDLRIISKYLLKPVMSLENNLVRLLLAQLNWNFDKSDQLFLPLEMHRIIARSILSASNEFYKDGMIPGGEAALIWENWVWKIILRLRLHILDLTPQMIYRYYNNPGSILSMIPETLSEIIVNEKTPLASFLSLLITQRGHSVPIICSYAFGLMQTLINATKYTETIIAINLIVPLFVTCPDSLVKSQSFKEIIVSLSNADKTYVKMAKNLIIATEPSPLMKQFGNMILYQLNNYKKYCLESKDKLIIMWLRIIISIDDWNNNLNLIYIANLILESGFNLPQDVKTEIDEIFREFLQNQVKSITQSNPTNSGISSLFSWISNPSTPPTFLLTPSGQYPWLAYYVLQVEHGELELRTGLWRELLTQLSDRKGKTNIDASLKKAAEVRHCLHFGSGFLSIYRWAQQAIDTPLSHPLMPLFWQRFFILFLTRVPTKDGKIDLGGVGNKFFDGVINFNFLKKIKRKLQESIEFYNENATNQPEKSEFYQKNSKLFKTFLFWLEEPRLHEPRLFLHSLSEAYRPVKLLAIFEGNNEPWLKYVDSTQTLANEKIAESEWLKKSCRALVTRGTSPVKSMLSPEHYRSNLLRRLSSYDQPKTAPKVPNTAPLFPMIPPNKLMDPQQIVRLVQPQIDSLTSFAKKYSLKVAEHTALNCTYIELLPTLYRHESTNIKQKVACKNGGQCSRPAIIQLNFVKSVISEPVLRQIRNNRTEYNNLVKEIETPLPQKLSGASVFILYISNMLQTEYESARSLNDSSKIEKVQKSAVELFYYLLSTVTEEIKLFSPVHNLLITCASKLGLNFIMNWDSEIIRLVTTAQKKPQWIDILSSLLNPPINGNNFLPGYIITTQFENTGALENVFMLLTKFDVEKWLSSRKPRLSERSELMTSVINALATIGLTPKPDHTLIHELLRNHLMLIFCHEWPEHYGEVLQALLHVSSKTTEYEGGGVSEAIWNDVLKTLGLKTISSGMTFTDEIRQYATNQTLLSHDEFVQSARVLSQHFTQERLKYGLYGLYPRYRPYVDSITKLLAMFGHALVVTTTHKYRGFLADKLCEIIWPSLIELYSPWLVPYWTKSLKDESAAWIQQLTDGRAAVLPWIHADANRAQKMLTSFVNNIRFIIDTLPACNIVLSYAWQFYFNNYAHSAVKDHVLTPVHATLLILPWERFWPTLQDLESMLKVLDQYLPECHVFTASVALKIPWVAWLEVVDISVVRSYLLPLLVKVAHEPAVQQQKSLQGLLTQAISFKWSDVDGDIYDRVMNWYVMSADPKTVLRLDDKVDGLILDLLKASAEYLPGKVGPFAGTKRKLFIRGYTRLLTSTASRHKTLVTIENKKFRIVIAQVLDDMENVLMTLPGDKSNEAQILLTEFLTILDDKNLTELATESISFWLSNRVSFSIVLQVTITLLGTIPQCPVATGAVLEAAVMGYFNQTKDAKWTEFLELVKNPSNLVSSRKLPETLAVNGNILALHIVIILRKGDLLEMQEVAEWVEKIKPNKAVEPKLPLIWYDFVKLLIPLCIKGQSEKDLKLLTEVRNALNKVIKYLQKVSEDKASWGSSLLGAIGIKNNDDSISNKCRFLCRAVCVYFKTQMCVSETSIYFRLEGGSPPLSLVSDLDSLRGYNQTSKACMDYAVKEIQDVSNSLHNIDEFILFLSQQLYNQPYLKKLNWDS